MTLEANPASAPRAAQGAERAPRPEVARPLPPPTTSPPAPASAPRPRRGLVMFVVLGALVLLGAGFGLRQYLFGRTHIATDDAQVEGHIIPVLPKVSGFVLAVNVDDNQNVRAGDTLVVLDDRELREKLAQAEADLAAAEATSGVSGRGGQAGAQIEAARAAVTQAAANAQKAHSDLERYRSLAPGGYVSRQQVDAANAAAKSADAQLDAMRRQVTAAQAGLGNASAKMVSAEAARDQAALNLSYTRLVAPTSGVVSRKTVEVGQLVQIGQPLMSVVPLTDVWVVANLKETDIANVQPGDPAYVVVDSYRGRRFAAHVESLSPATGAKFSLLPPDNATGNFTKVVQRVPVRLRLDAPPDPTHPLRPGMSVTVHITTK